ncbi:hypothetical protein TNCV_4653941 [Trichonephila clavipes]|nr:hypothetical protein TNCV_4653941 [Trichonephila clavipes]
MRTYVWLEAMLVLLGTRQEVSVGLHMKMWVDDVRCLPADLMTSKSREGNLPTRRLLLTNLEILNPDLVTRTTPPIRKRHPPNFHTVSSGACLSFDRYNLHRSPTWRVFSSTRLELKTRWPRVRYLDHKDTTAIFQRKKENQRERWRGGAYHCHLL